MTAPTQQLPSWLSISTSLATDAAGLPTATFTTLINLPLTYYGPPIPLGTDGSWVYGGLSSPEPSAASSPTNSALTPTTPATPPSTSALSSTPATPPSTSATPSSTPSLPSPSSTLPSTLTLPSPSTTSHTSSSSSAPPSSTTSSVPAGALSSHSSHTGVIVGSVLGSVLGSLLLLFLFIFCLRKRQRNQRQRNRPTEDPPMSQVMWMWHDVHRNDYDQDADLDAQLRSPGEGSPVGSGDERDAFLRRSGDAPAGTRNGETTARLVDAPRSSQDSSGRPIGIALTAGADAMIAERKSARLSGASRGTRHIISREQLAQAEASGSPKSPDDFPKSPEEAELGVDAPLLPPPAFNLNVSHGSRKSLLNSERSVTPGNEPESAMLYTAQRVRVGKNAVPSSSSGSGPSWTEAIGGIPSILRRSWLSPRPRSETPNTLSTKSSLLTRQLTDNELEAGRSQMRGEMGYREGARPVSGLSTGSARSGTTVFYDAESREQAASTPPPVPPLPQGTTSTGRTGAHAAPSPLSGEPIGAPDDGDEGEGPPAYEPTASNKNNDDELADYLDAPVPRPASPFASVSSPARAFSPRPPPPPGLALPNPHVWRDSATTPSNTSAGIDIDVLEEAPPAAGESWRQLAAQGLPSIHERRTTFGLPMTAISEQGSLHSMRSHLSPHSALSAAGSAPVSNSASEHSRAFTINSLKSLAHSSSISSTDRRPLVRPSPGEVSPALSAMGGASRRPPPVAMKSATVTSIGSSVTTHMSVTDPVTGEVSRVVHPVWTGGRERERERDRASPVPGEAAWGGEGWSSPSHLKVLQNRVAGRDGASHA